MTVKQVLARARSLLAENNIEDAPLEAEMLLRDTLHNSRAQLFSELNRELAPEQEKAFWHRIERRLSHEPATYITGHREFYGLDFYVDPRVLIPRPETELLVEKALALVQNKHLSTIAEVGTGCGAIAVSLALQLPHVKVYATDISEPALEVALSNCCRHGVETRVCLLAGDMLEPLPGPVDLIVANLPYVRKSELPHIDTFGFEPNLALDGGADGLDNIRRLCLQSGGKLRPDGHLLLEIGTGQTGAVTAFLHRLFPSARIDVSQDLTGIDRVVSLSLS
jgi:release factor glutamine methyltransferase